MDIFGIWYGNMMIKKKLVGPSNWSYATKIGRITLQLGMEMIGDQQSSNDKSS